MSVSKQYVITLETRSPLFVGSGDNYTKKDYLYDPRSQRVSVVDSSRLMAWLVSCGRPEAIDEYEKFMLGNQKNYYLKEFFDRMRIGPEDRKKMIIYETDAGAALSEYNSLKDIKAFMRDAYERPYIPGSSLKGALRTAILVKMIRDEDGGISPRYPDDFTRSKHADTDIEGGYLHTLGRNSKQPNAVNSIMSGISISDSVPLEQSSMTLAKKIDIFSDGEDNPLNVVRECVKPGVKINFKLTIYPKLAGKISAQYIRSAITDFGEYYYETYSKKFKHPLDTDHETFDDCLVF
ncbi:MAG: type III-A CRISPR-associated RAMP protein Csm5, partial [Synergistaceae bacterium]|nr:type III-A CRISPR-associated RAMP protein Csm5 [Synergistaceae bacterium]